MADIDALQDVAKNLVSLLKTRIYSQHEAIEHSVITLLCQGHALLTGAPGVAKTSLVRDLAGAIGCGYKRIQFTPDLTPFDILGGETIRFDAANPYSKQLVFVPGPLFAPFVIADEINRASPRTQSALLEAMQERQVTTNGLSRPLPTPFYVFATQNPIESEGTFPLPEAQLDRFLLSIDVPYPNFEAEVQIACLPQLRGPILLLEQASLLFSSGELLKEVQMSQGLLEGIVRIVRNTRPENSRLEITREWIDVGASPRACQALVLASKAFALLQGEKKVDYVHIATMAPPVLRHRCLFNFKALAAKKKPTYIIEEIIKQTVL